MPSLLFPYSLTASKPSEPSQQLPNSGTAAKPSEPSQQLPNSGTAAPKAGDPQQDKTIAGQAKEIYDLKQEIISLKETSGKKDEVITKKEKDYSYLNAAKNKTDQLNNIYKDLFNEIAQLFFQLMENDTDSFKEINNYIENGKFKKDAFLDEKFKSTLKDALRKIKDALVNLKKENQKLQEDNQVDPSNKCKSCRKQSNE